MSEFAGTATLTWFILRRDLVRILVWVGAIAALVVLTAASVKGLYPTQADLDEAARASHGNAAAIAFNGPDQGLDTMGGQVAFQVGTIGLIVVALMSTFMVGRETRAEEEAGRLELVRSMAVGRRATAAAALIVTAGMNLLVGAVVALGLVGLNLPTTGAVVFGASFVSLGLVFAGVALVAAQVTENTRVTYGLSGIVIGAAFVLRAAGDTRDGTLSWLSPIGWAQKTRPFAGDRWWPLLIPIVATVGLLAVAGALANRRDVGAGLVAPRPGPATAAARLGGPISIAVRLQRGSVVGWSAGLFLLGVVYGSIANDVEEFVGDNHTVQDLMAPEGGASLTDSYLSRALLIAALVGSGYAISSALRLRSEETSLHAEPVLATPVSRPRWVASQLVVTLVGSLVVLAAAGLGTGLSYAIGASDPSQVPRLIGAALVYAPAVLVLVGLATALFGFAPRGVTITWGVLAICFVIGMLADILNLPTWLINLSPFEHIPALPADNLAVVPLAILAVIAASLTSAGVVGFRRRDLG